jgi:DNA-binding ferritin-like protein
MTHFSVTGHRHLVSEQTLKRLEDAETAVRRALQTIERQIHLAKNAGDDDSREMVSTVERELELALAELRSGQQEG